MMIQQPSKLKLKHMIFCKKSATLLLAIFMMPLMSSCQHLVGERGLIYDHYNDYKQDQEENELLSPHEIKAIAREEFYPIAPQVHQTTHTSMMPLHVDATTQELPPDSALALSYRYLEFAGTVVPISNAHISKVTLLHIAKAANPSATTTTTAPLATTPEATGKKSGSFLKHVGLGPTEHEGGYRSEIDLNRIGTNSGYVKINKKHAQEQHVLLIHNTMPEGYSAKLMNALQYALRVNGFRVVGMNATQDTIYFISLRSGDQSVLPETPVYQLHLWHNVADIQQKQRASFTEMSKKSETPCIVFITDNHGQFLNVERAKRILNKLNTALLGQREFSYLQWIKEVLGGNNE